MAHTKAVLAVALLASCCSCVISQELSVDAATDVDPQDRDRRSIDVGWLVRNLLLNSATALDSKANATRNLAAAPFPTPPPPPPRRGTTTRRPRPRRPITTAAPPPPPPATPAPPQPSQPQINALFNLFAGSSGFWKIPPPAPSTTTTPATTTEELVTLPPPPPPPRRPRPRPHSYSHSPSHGWGRHVHTPEYEYFYPSGYESISGYGGQRADPSEYDFSDIVATAPPPPPASPRKSSGRSRQRSGPAPSAAPPQVPIPTQPARTQPPARRRPATTAPARAPAPTQAAAPPAGPPQRQRAKVLYEYLQQEDTSFNDNNDDVDQRPAPTPEAAIRQQQQDDDNGNGGEDGGDATDGGVNEIPRFENGTPQFDDDFSSRAPSFGLPSDIKSSPPRSPFGSQSYFNTDLPPAHRLSSFNLGADKGSSVYEGSSSYDIHHHASPTEGAYKFRDAFSDFETTYDGGHIHSSSFGSYK